MRGWSGTKLVARLLVGASLVAWSSMATAQAAAKSEQNSSVPSLGVPVEAHRGFYSDFGIGTLFAFKGANVSDAQPYLGLGIGYDIGQNLTLGFNLGMGAASGVCFAAVCNGNAQGVGTSGADSFSLLLADLFVGYLHPLSQQWFVGGKLLGGGALLGPVPSVADGAVPGRLAFGFGGGLLATTELHTYLNHFVIGADLGAHFISGGGANILAMEIAARFKYVF